VANEWYDTMPCMDGEGRRFGLTVASAPARGTVEISLGGSGGERIAVRLAPGWARALAALIINCAQEADGRPAQGLRARRLSGDSG
jgi:hypothetical protein